MNVNSRTKERHTRLAEIERELALLKKKKRSLERSWKTEPMEEAGETPREAPAPAGAREDGPDVPRSAENRPGGDPETLEWGVPGEAGDRRERFASYFMSGNLGRSGAQLKRERRAQRNKAILMAIFAAFLLYVVINFLVKTRVDF